MTSFAWRDLSISTELDAVITVDQPAAHLARIHVDWQPHEIAHPVLQIAWSCPITDMQYEWHPGSGTSRRMQVDWEAPVTSRISSSAPVFCFYNAKGRNRMTIALSDALTEIACSLGVHEENGDLLCKVEIPLDPSARTSSYDVTLYRSGDDVSFAQALRSVSAWWENECGYTPTSVPADARMPLYSTWYSYHQATFADKLEAECARAAELGMRAVIVDDGWQTSDGNRGYGYCGDWEPYDGKIPDMKRHVDAVHALGMKYMLWYSVPFIGFYAKRWNDFKDKLLGTNEQLNTGVLDPRYPEVRAFLIDKYRSAMIDWGLDGFKLDFIDSFLPTSQAPAATDEMDYTRVEDAVLRLMTDVREALCAINPDVMIEFRQSYIGPAMRTYGNMFRVSDCPDDVSRNRVGIADLRLLSGNTAIHSDMLMWHPEDTVEAAARQLLSVIFGVPQISMPLAELPDAHRKMLTFWLKFITEHQTLLAAPLDVEEPNMLYPVMRTRLGDEEMIALYGSNRIVRISDAQTVYVINASAEETVFIDGCSSGCISVELIDCSGESVGMQKLGPSDYHRLQIPVCGMAVIRK